MDNHSTFGPEWLQSVADRTDDESTAIAFRQMARDWNEEKRQLEEARTDNSKLQRTLDNVRQAASVSA